MSGYIAYIRVSTVRQGTKGVSLAEQKDAILRYAERNHLPISTWFEEMETAAKRGRPEFAQAMKLLRQGKADGIILHKLDRGARNLRDWADLGELVDYGIEIHFVHENLDLNSRGGRLSADIQAVVAADYIRNLRDECRKGFYGRLKQGLYPLPAPLGYLNQGTAKVKAIDPVSGPLVKRAFELYATARFNFDQVREEMHRRGLRNRSGVQVSRNGFTSIFNNPFYIGIIRVEKTGETFPGIHEPLISKALFDRVQAVLTGKANIRTLNHLFIFRRLLSCAKCQYSLVGERQKNHVYYRCHSKQCAGTSLREDSIEAPLKEFLQSLRFNEKENLYFRQEVVTLRADWALEQENEIQGLKLKVGQIKDRLNRLTDAYLDAALDKAMFEERKSVLLLERKTVEENLTKLTNDTEPLPDKVEKFLELANNAWLSYKIALPEEKGEVVKIFTSNRLVDGKKLELKPSFLSQQIAIAHKNTYGGVHRDRPRTFAGIIAHLSTLNTQGLLPGLESDVGCEDKDSEHRISVKKRKFALWGKKKPRPMRDRGKITFNL